MHSYRDILTRKEREGVRGSERGRGKQRNREINREREI